MATSEDIVKYFTETKGLPAVDETDKEIARIKADLVKLEKVYRDKLIKYDSDTYSKLYPNRTLFGVPSGELQKYKDKLKTQQDEGVMGKPVSKKAMSKAKKEFEKAEKQYLNTKKRLDNKEAERISTIIKRMKWRGEPETLLRTMSLYLINKDKADLKDVSFDYINETWNRYFTQELKENLFLPKLRFRNDYETYQTYKVTNLISFNGNIQTDAIKRVYSKQVGLIVINGQTLLNQARRAFMNLQRKVQDDIVEEYDRFMKTGRAGRYVNARRVQRLATLRVNGSDLDQADFDIIHKGVDQKGYETYLQWAKEQHLRLPLEGETVTMTELSELNDVYNDLDKERQSLDLLSMPTPSAPPAPAASTPASPPASPTPTPSAPPAPASTTIESDDDYESEPNNEIALDDEPNNETGDQDGEQVNNDVQQVDVPTDLGEEKQLSPLEKLKEEAENIATYLKSDFQNYESFSKTSLNFIEQQLIELLKLKDPEKDKPFYTSRSFVALFNSINIDLKSNNWLTTAIKEILLDTKGDDGDIRLIREAMPSKFYTVMFEKEKNKAVSQSGLNTGKDIKGWLYDEWKEGEKDAVVGNVDQEEDGAISDDEYRTPDSELKADLLVSDNEMEGYEAYTDSDLDNLLTGYEIDNLSGSYSDSGSYSGSYDMDESDRD